MALLLTWTQYKKLTGVTVDTDQVLYEGTVGPAVDAAVQSYCDRQFALVTEIEWAATATRISDVWLAVRYPIVGFLGCYSPKDGLKIENDTANDLIINVTSAGLTYGDPSTLSTTDLAWADAATIQDVADELESSDITVTVLESATTNSRLLQPGLYTAPSGGEVSLPIAVQNGGAPRAITENIFVDVGSECIVYKGGYATIPLDLQRTIAMIAKQALAQANGVPSAATPGMQSETIGKYSYSLADGVDFGSILAGYEAELANWRRPVVA